MSNLSNSLAHQDNLQKAVAAKKAASAADKEKRQHDKRFRYYIKLVPDAVIAEGFNTEERDNPFSYARVVEFLHSKPGFNPLWIQEFESKTKTTHTRYTPKN
tara:strand:- start:195 stop:500 length:306 start_codon:yes stop_codon:yes gene_type:complete